MTGIGLISRSPRKIFLKRRRKSLSILFAGVIASGALWAVDPADRLFCELEKARQIDRNNRDRLPVLLNYQGIGGYFNMPSARMEAAGEFGLGYSYLPPYRLWNLTFQFFDRIETGGSYWIYRGIPDETFGHCGFGDYADRTANIKIALLKRQDSAPILPDLSIGWIDFLGSCRFLSFYAVGTQEVLDWNLEASLGWGQGRIKGFFGALAWTPWRQTDSFLKGLSAAVEYDANDYQFHPTEHPWGRNVRSRFNAGLHYALGNWLKASCSSIRGEDWAASLAVNYNLGESKGFFPKILDPCPYKAPIDTEPIGRLREARSAARDLAWACQEQGLDLYSAYLIPGQCGCDSLWIKVVNMRYREEIDVRERVQKVLAALAPSNLDRATVVVEADGVAADEYVFCRSDLARYQMGALSMKEFQTIAPMREARPRPSKYEAAELYQRSKPMWMISLRPCMQSYFGSSSGKFKYDLGVCGGPEGYLFDQVYYFLQASATAVSSSKGIGDRDCLNPSKLINVRTDSIRYRQGGSFHIDAAYLQKSWNLGRGWFSRLGVGYFEMAYGGAAWEALYYPVESSWAFGLEAAAVWKRKYYGLGFTDKIRKLEPEGYIWVPFTGFQYFLNLYYDYKPLGLDFKVGAGQFLAKDLGARLDFGRTFSSGLRVGLWMTWTNAGDEVNGSRYYDKGFSITMPLDLFMTKSSRTRIGYGMSAWLRDCGAKAATGKELYRTLYFERYNSRSVF